jgi:hypothetical protein
MRSLINFGYTWPWTHGHLAVVAAAAALLAVAWARRWHWLSKDAWMRFASGPVMMHGANAGRIRARWPSMLEAAGFRVVEQGTTPATFFVRAIRRQ